MIDLDQARKFLHQHHNGILATLKRDGRPQLSNVLYLLDEDSRIKVSVTEARAKTKNLRRDPRATLHVQGRDWYEFVVVDGIAEFVEGPGVAQALRDHYRKIRGEHPNWEEYDAAMIRDQRLLLSIEMTYAYGILR